MLLRLSESWRNSERTAEMHFSSFKKCWPQDLLEVHEMQVSVWQEECT